MSTGTDEERELINTFEQVIQGEVHPAMNALMEMTEETLKGFEKCLNEALVLTRQIKTRRGIS